MPSGPEPSSSLDLAVGRGLPQGAGSSSLHAKSGHGQGPHAWRSQIRLSPRRIRSWGGTSRGGVVRICHHLTGFVKGRPRRARVQITVLDETPSFFIGQLIPQAFRTPTLQFWSNIGFIRWKRWCGIITDKPVGSSFGNALDEWNLKVFCNITNLEFRASNRLTLILRW